jgi:gliding motility-associated-like protein
MVTTTYTLTGYISQTPCPTYDTQTVTIVVNQPPFAKFDVTPDVVYVDEPTFTLVNTSTGANSFKWYRGVSEMFSNDPSPSVTESAVGTFCYTLVAESSAGCVDSTTDCGDVIRRERVFFPGAFTPNGDHRNDEFKPVLVNMDMRAVTGFSLVIANRFGEVMYKSFDPSAGWDGTWRGGKCELGTYYYICQFVTPQGEVHNVKGDVTLIY